MKEPMALHTVMTDIVLMFHVTSLVQLRLNISIHGSKAFETVKKTDMQQLLFCLYIFDCGLG
jgi:hypothetical protein